MAELDHITDHVEKQVDQLIELHQSALKEIDLLKKENEALSEKLESGQKEIAELRNKSLTRDLGQSLRESDGDPAVVKKRINKLIREVDKCIEHLNQN